MYVTASLPANQRSSRGTSDVIPWNCPSWRPGDRRPRGHPSNATPTLTGRERTLAITICHWQQKAEVLPPSAQVNRATSQENRRKSGAVQTASTRQCAHAQSPNVMFLINFWASRRRRRRECEPGAWRVLALAADLSCCEGETVSI